MINIYINTPLYRNSDYVPHIIEHAVLGDIQTPKNFFVSRKLSGDTYTYYTNIKIDSDDVNYLDYILSEIQKPLQNKKITYEIKVIKDELSGFNYSTKLTNKVGGQIYNSSLKYSQTHKVKYSEIKEYHKIFYQRTNMVVLPYDYQEKDIDLGNFEVKNLLNLRVGYNKEKVYIFDYSSENLFAVEILTQLLDYYFAYQERYFEGKYYLSDIVYGEFYDFIFLSIPQKCRNFIELIDNNFIKEFIGYKLNNFDKEEFVDVDGPLIMKYGNTLSINSKKEIIENIGDYFELTKKSLLIK